MQPKACWILCDPRTGSSFLCDLLNNTQAFPVYTHPRMRNKRGPLEIGQAFNEWARLFDNVQQMLHDPPPYAKMIHHQYVETVAGLPKDQRYHPGWYPTKHDMAMLVEYSIKYDSRFVRRIFPDISFIRLTRNVVSHAVSLYIARSTTKYHIYDKNTLDTYLKTKIEIDDARLLEAYKDAVNYTESWSRFLDGTERLLRVNYEDLVEKPVDTLSSILNFLGVQTDVQAAVNRTLGNEKRLFRMTRPDAQIFEDRLNLIRKVKL